MIITIKEAIAFLEKYIPIPEKKHPGELGLKRMEYLMKLLGDPQLKYRTIHVGGTSGKGSTATFIASILATKFKVGLHTSPHLVSVTERIQIWNMREIREIGEKEFIKLLNQIVPVLKGMEKTRFGPPSYFEIISAMAFLYFYLQKVDVAVVEVGMGGRFDATNVIKPLVAVLTNVGLDHTDVLGNTMEEIAIDKVGIIKSGINVVSGVKQRSVINIIESRIKNQESRLSLINKDFKYLIKSISLNGCIFDYFGDNNYRNLNIKLLGEHQVENAALGIRAIELLSNVTMKRGNNVTIMIEDIRKGLQRAFVPGRMEIISRKPLVIFDGAHNTDKMKALVKAVKEIFPDKKVTVILAIKKEKKAREMMSSLLTIADNVILTEYKLIGDLGTVSSYDSTDLLNNIKRIRTDIKFEIINNPLAALNTAISRAKDDSLILVTGSLYLVGEIKRNFQFLI